MRLILLTAALLLVTVACSIDHGITRVGTAERQVMAAALSTTELERTTEEEFSYFVSDDGGDTWRPSVSPTDVQWGEGPAHTPRGTFSIQGPDIVLTTEAGTVETVFSAAD